MSLNLKVWNQNVWPVIKIIIMDNLLIQSVKDATLSITGDQASLIIINLNFPLKALTPNLNVFNVIKWKMQTTLHLSGTK